MGKAKRHEKAHNKPHSAKSAGQNIRKRQHSQHGILNRPVKAATTPSLPKKDVNHPQKLKVPFTKSDRILLVGEGDFSFTLSLVKHHKVGAVVATSYDDHTTLKTKYPQVSETLKSLQEPTRTAPHDTQEAEEVENGWEGFSVSSTDDGEHVNGKAQLKSNDIEIFHGIDATALSKSHKKALCPHAPFTKIVFNFPHTGGLSTDVNRQVRANQELLVKFFNAAKPFLATKARPARKMPGDQSETEDYDEYIGDDEVREGHDVQQHTLSSGQILVTLFEGEPYTLWNIRDLARHCGLQVIESFKFPWAAYPGYKHARTVGDIVTGKDRSHEGKRKGAWRGEEREARCYMLGLKGEVNNVGGRKRKRETDDSDESE